MIKAQNCQQRRQQQPNKRNREQKNHHSFSTLVQKNTNTRVGSMWLRNGTTVLGCLLLARCVGAATEVAACRARAKQIRVAYAHTHTNCAHCVVHESSWTLPQLSDRCTEYANEWIACYSNNSKHKMMFSNEREYWYARQSRRPNPLPLTVFEMRWKL